MLLALDAGNSSVKFGLFSDGMLIEEGRLDFKSDLRSFINTANFQQIERIVSSSVLKDIRVGGLPDVEHLLITSASNFPFKISYSSPKTLGVDRLVASAAVYEENTNYLVIDVGTCVTYDIVTLDEGFLGGAISPGLSIRLKGMHNFTEQLPLVHLFESDQNSLLKLTGMSTVECMESGAFNGLKFEILGFIEAFKSNYPKLKVYLTGGGYEILGKELKSDIFAQRNLVLYGLHYLSKLND